MSVLNWLSNPGPPWLGLQVTSEADRKWNISHVLGANPVDRIVRVVRGHKMRTIEGLMNEFGAAFQFFEAFGENWHALNDCLCYLDEWMPAASYVVVVRNVELVLIDESAAELGWLLVTLHEVAQFWSAAIADNDRFDRPSVPFHSLLQCEGTHRGLVESRISQALSQIGKDRIVTVGAF